MHHCLPDLTANRRDDGSFELWQSPDLADDFDGRIVLHPTHVALLAQSAGFVPAERVTEACERLRDRINLLSSMVRAMTSDSDPLRAAVDAIVGPTPSDRDLER